MPSYLNIATGEYPVSFAMLKIRMKDTSFPSRIDSIGDYRLVKDGEIPTFDQNTQYVLEGAPIYVKGNYVRNWLVHNYSQQQIDQKAANRFAAAAKSVRSQRDTLLSETDWVTIKAIDTSSDGLGIQIPQTWVDYRQALRDITDHANFPWLDDADWPVKPE